MKLIATKSMRYAGRGLKAGDAFSASARDAKILKAVRRATDAPIPDPEEFIRSNPSGAVRENLTEASPGDHDLVRSDTVNEPPVTIEADGDEQSQKPRRAYKRRDMQAED